MRLFDELRLASFVVLIGLMAALAPATATAIDASYSGSWYHPPESGSGFNLEIISGERALLFWYVYDDAGEPVWLYSEGELDGESIDFVVYYSDGMRFGDLDAADRTNRVWGSLTMSFADCNHATIAYASTLTGLPHSPVGTRTFPVERLVNIASLPCRRAAEGYYTGWIADPSGAGGVVDLEGLLSPKGRMYLRSVASNEVFTGAFATTGDALTSPYLSLCTDSETESCVYASVAATYETEDHVRGTITPHEGTSRPFGLVYRTIYDRAPDLASLAGDYSATEDGVTYTLAVDASGTVTGTDTNDCEYEGDLEPTTPASEANAFDVRLVVQGRCQGDDWTIWGGGAVNLDDVPGDRRDLLMIVDDSEGGRKVALRLRR
jgi:hypothetical protein